MVSQAGKNKPKNGGKNVDVKKRAIKQGTSVIKKNQKNVVKKSKEGHKNNQKMNDNTGKPATGHSINKASKKNLNKVKNLAQPIMVSTSVNKASKKKAMLEPSFMDIEKEDILNANDDEMLDVKVNSECILFIV